MPIHPKRALEISQKISLYSNSYHLQMPHYNILILKTVELEFLQIEQIFARTMVEQGGANFEPNFQQKHFQPINPKIKQSKLCLKKCV